MARVVKNIRGNKEKESATLEMLCSGPVVCSQNSCSFIMSECDPTENMVFADVIKGCHTGWAWALNPMTCEHTEEGTDRITHTVIGGHTEKHRETQGKRPSEDGGWD